MAHATLTPPGTRSALVVSNVTKQLGGCSRNVLQNVSATFEEGRITLLLGANGAGKTTLLRIAAGLVLPASGLVTYRDDAGTTHSAAVAAQLVACDERSFSWRLSSHDNLVLFARLAAVPDTHSRISSVLRFLGMSDHAHVPVGRLSSGQRQRLALCRAMLSTKRVLLLDEPTRGLDPAATSEFLTLLRRTLADTCGYAVVLSSHQPAETVSIADQVLVLRDGRSSYLGPAAGAPLGPAGYIRYSIAVPHNARLHGALSHLPDVITRQLSETFVAVLQPAPVSPERVSAVMHVLARHGGVVTAVAAEDVRLPPEAPLLLATPAGLVRGAPHTVERASAARGILRVARSVAAIVWAEVLELCSYRVAIAINTLSLVTLVLLIGLWGAPTSHSATGLPVPPPSYVHYVVVGLVVTMASFGISRGIPARVRDYQVKGKLDAILTTGISLPALTLAFGVVAFAQALVNAALPLLALRACGTPLLVQPKALLALALGLPAFVGIGMFSAAFIVVFKRGDPVSTLVGLMSWIAGGVIVPPEVLPHSLRAIGEWLPLTTLLSAVRDALLPDPTRAGAATLASLGAMSAVFMAVGSGALRLASWRLRITGSSTQY